MRRIARRRTAWVAAAGTLLAVLCPALPSFATAAATASTSSVAPTATVAVALDASTPGRTFDGIGAVSGGGGNSRLLIDYPEPARSQILDYLFKPGYGANLQILKVEIGGDTNSTDGAESSHEHARGVVNCTSGYEWWLMEQAKARNPAIKLAALEWGAPGWLTPDAGSTSQFWSQDNINYLMQWLGCAKTNGLSIGYLGGWNENGYVISWYDSLRAALDATRGQPSDFSGVQIIGSDDWPLDYMWKVGKDMQADPTFKNAVGVIGVHYPCGTSQDTNVNTITCVPTDTTSWNNAVATGRPLWQSEAGSKPYDTGADTMAFAINRGYLDAKTTAFLNWPIVASLYPSLPYHTDGMLLANQPWSGNFSIDRQVWATAHTTQFAQPGWTYLDSASGYLGGTPSNGSYVTLKPPSGSDYSTVIETTTATAAQTATFTVSGGLSTGTVHVWATNLRSTDPAQWFVNQSDITPVNAGYSLTLQPGYLYTLTTTTGQSKGAATSPARSALALPYSDTLGAGAVGSEPRYLADQNGAFAIQPCDGGRSGQCLRQMATAAPIRWSGAGPGTNPYTTLGDLGWSDYTVKSDVLLENPGSVQVMCRVGTEYPTPDKIDAYYAQLDNTGAWSIDKISTAGGAPTILQSGNLTLANPQTWAAAWHTLALSCQGAVISASLDGSVLGSATDYSFAQGQVGLGVGGFQTAGASFTGYTAEEFGNLSVTPLSAPPAVGYKLVNRNSKEVLAVSDVTQASGGQIVQAVDNGAASEQWKVVTDGSGYSVLTNVGSGAVLDVPGFSTAQGTQLDQWPANGGMNQEWTLTAVGGYDTLTSRSSGMLVDVSGASTSAGAPVIQWPATGGSNQQWQLVAVGGATETVSVTGPGSQTGTVGTAASLQVSATDSAGKALTYSATSLPAGLSINSGSGLISGTPATAGTSTVTVTATSGTASGSTSFTWTVNPAGSGGGTYRLVNRNSGEALAVSDVTQTNGGSIVQAVDTGAVSEQWKVVTDGSGYSVLTNVGSGSVLDVPGNSTTQGVQLDQWPANGGTNQEWTLTAAGGYYTLTSHSSGQLADVSGASTTVGAPVIQWPATGGSNQEWQLVAIP